MSYTETKNMKGVLYMIPEEVKEQAKKYFIENHNVTSEECARKFNCP